MVGPPSGQRTRAAYFLCQTIATAAWWLVVVMSPEWRKWFAFGDDGRSLWPFLPADLVFWCAGSLALSYGEWCRASWTPALRLVVCGGLGCSVLHAAALATLCGAGWVGVLFMFVALGVTVWLTWSATWFRS
jgi:hypothetical protein